MEQLILDDVYDVYFTSFWQTWLGCAILILLVSVFLMMLYGLIRYYRRGSRKDQVLKALRALEGESDSKKVYRELIGVIKWYAQWRFGVPKGATDYELTQLLTDEKIQKIIIDAQAVKFGHAVVLKEVMQKDIVTSITFIEETIEEEH